MDSISKPIADLSIMHIGAGRYDPNDRSHPTWDIWRRLALGFRSYTVFVRSNDASGALVEEGNLRIYMIPSYFRSEFEFFILQFKMLLVVKCSRPDVIVCQSTVLGGLAATLAKFLFKSKILVEMHGAEYFHSNERSFKAKFLIIFSKCIMKYFDRIRLLSEGMRRDFIQIYGSEFENRIRLLPPRVDLNCFTKSERLEKGDNGAPLQIAMLGAVNPNKGQMRALNALILSRASVLIHIIGDGPDLEECKILVKSAGWNERVFFHGRKNHQDVAAILRSVDVFLMYSKSEGTPRAIIEAMASGLPVITTDVGYCADLVCEGVNGFLLKDNVDEQLVRTLEILSRNRDLGRRMGFAGREKATTCFDGDSLFAQYRALILEASEC